MRKSEDRFESRVKDPALSKSGMLFRAQEYGCGSGNTAAAF